MPAAIIHPSRALPVQALPASVHTTALPARCIRINDMSIAGRFPKSRHSGHGCRSLLRRAIMIRPRALCPALLSVETILSLMCGDAASVCALEVGCGLQTSSRLLVDPADCDPFAARERRLQPEQRPVAGGRR